jgi:hypothetical protein
MHGGGTPLMHEGRVIIHSLSCMGGLSVMHGEEPPFMKGEGSAVTKGGGHLS